MNLVTFTNDAQIGLSILPGLLENIKAIENQSAAIAAAGGPVLSGATKKQIVTQGVLSGIQAGAQAGEQIPNVYVATISALIDGIVSIFKTSGVFKPITASASATLPPPVDPPVAATGPIAVPSAAK